MTLKALEGGLWANIVTSKKIKKVRSGRGWNSMENLKNAAKKALIQLYYIYKASIEFGHFPEQWKKAIIIPIKNPSKSPIEST